MRKVCLSKCFKRKMSNGLKIFWQTIIGIIITLLIMVTVILLMAATGWGLSHIFEINPKGYSLAGLLFYLGLIAMYLVGFWLWKLHKHLTSSAFKFIREKYESTYDSCSIFEYCDEQETIK